MRAALGATFAVLVAAPRGVRRRRGERRAGRRRRRRRPPRPHHADGRRVRRTSRRPRRARTAAPPSRPSASTPRRRGRSASRRRAARSSSRSTPTSAPATAASLVSLAEQGYFDDTVFHRIVPGFVIQGGDPTQSGSGGPGLLDRRRRRRRAPATSKGVVAMAKTAGGAGRHVGEPVLRRHRRRHRPAARLRDRRRGHRGPRRRRADRHARRPGDGAAAPADRHRVGHRLVELRPMGRIAAVVLAAGAATRFGAPKQRLLLPRVLERVAESPVDEIVVVEGAYDLRERLATSRCPPRPLPRLGARAGRVAPLRARRARGRRRGGGRAHGGRARPLARGGRARASRTGGRTAARSSPRRTPESAATRSSSRGPRGRTSRTTAFASSRRGSSRATTSARRATSTRPRICLRASSVGR